jgi:hypothetical protein
MSPLLPANVVIESHLYTDVHTEILSSFQSSIHLLKRRSAAEYLLKLQSQEERKDTSKILQKHMPIVQE